MSVPWGEAKRVGENTPWRISVTLRVRQFGPAVVFGEDDGVHHRPHLRTIDPAQHLGVGYPWCAIAMVAVSGDTPRRVRGAGQQRL